MEEPRERAIRSAAMAWLDGRNESKVDYAWTTQFEYEGQRIPLMDRQRGIRKPAGMSAALAIRTTFTPRNQIPPYDDALGRDGLQRYKYRGTDPNHPENIALRRAMQAELPLIWFVGVGASGYEPIYPVWIAFEEERQLQFALALDQAQRFITPGTELDVDTRQYMQRLTRTRLHQRVFRTQVLLAYEGRCAVCNLGHRELLDAAHIIADGLAHGEPVVPNGMAMCKIHHAAFDTGILGVRPDLTMHVRQDILEEVDGPMLRHGLQDMHDRALMKVPGSIISRPDPERLEERYAAFLAV